MALLTPFHSDLTAPLPWEPQPDTRSWLSSVALLIGAMWVIVDQASKQLAAVLLSPAGVVRQEIPGPITFQLTFNDGGANGWNGPWWIFLTVTAIVTAIVVYKLPRTQTMLEANAYGMLLAGAWGNGFDRVFREGDPGDPRFFHGHVVDFFASASFPTFNVADMAIVLGFLLLLVAIWQEGRREARAKRLRLATA